LYTEQCFVDDVSVGKQVWLGVRLH